MPYILNTPDEQHAMLEAIGVSSLDDLFTSIPSALRLDRPLEMGPALTEMELSRHMAELAARNQPAGEKVCFLGGGSYDHFIPAVVDAIASRGEYYTSYTPYQPEVSQGNLQAMFEYQTLICQLTAMDVSNASLYDGGSATAEAVLMAMSVTKRSGKVLVLDSVHPEYRQVLETYLENLDTELVTVASANGGDVKNIAVENIAAEIDANTACVVVQSPNFFGCLEDVETLARAAHEKGALLVMVFDPISLGLLKRPGEMDVDIVVAEGQSLGSPMSFGGPYLGIMACRERFVRRLPGRIAGETVDRRGRRCWVLTLQTREQHIRRDKATSNICTNQGLFALRATIYLAAMGPQGLRETSELCLQKAHYAAAELTKSERFTLAFEQPFFQEFVVRDRAGDVEGLMQRACGEGLLAGVPLGRWYDDLSDCFLVTVTEKRTRAEIDRLVRSLSGVSEQAAIPA